MALDTMAGFDANSAAAGNQYLRTALDSIRQSLAVLDSRTGGGMLYDRSAQTTAAAPPAVGTISVAGSEGTFICDITNPKDQAPQTVKQLLSAQTLNKITQLGGDIPEKPSPTLPPAVYESEIQSSLSIAWDVTGDLRTYGPSTATHVVITDTPNQLRYFRFHSRKLGGQWNDWAYFVDPVICGLAGVYSGVTSSTNTALANQATTPSGGNPLTQHGVTTQIDVAASVWKAGNLTINYSPGFVDPGAYGTYYVYADDPKKAGGTVTFHATTNNADITAADGRIFFGRITTAGGGGGTGGGGGSGGGCRAAGVMIEMLDATFRDAKDVRKRDVLRGHDGGPEVVQRVEMIPNVPCFRFLCENGVEYKGCSSDEPIRRSSGALDRAFHILPGDEIRTRRGVSRVKSREFIGNLTVYKYELDRMKTLYCDEVECHNKMML